MVTTMVESSHSHPDGRKADRQHHRHPQWGAHRGRRERQSREEGKGDEVGPAEAVGDGLDLAVE